jgi:hypothetical protein
MNEQQFGNQIRQALDEGKDLDARTLERLRAARMNALEHRRAGPERVHAFAGNGSGRVGGPFGFSRTVLLPALLLVLGLASLYSAQQKRQVAEASELDAQLLADELPIDAYLDKGFEAWLKKRRPQ